MSTPEPDFARNVKPHGHPGESRGKLIGLPGARTGGRQKKADVAGPVVCIDHKTRARLGALLESHHRLRYRTFLDQLYWGGVSSFRGMEYDEYDTLAAHYLVRPSIAGTALGCVRLAPTDRPYMLKDKWPEMCSRRTLPASMSVWEFTRLCVDQTLSKDIRVQIKKELVCSLLEFGLLNDIQSFIGVMHPRLWQSVFADAGWHAEFLGEEMVVGKAVARAGMVSISRPLLESVRGILGLPSCALRLQ